ncbi:MAG: hypothetical protein A2Z83_05730 [Omnitrophica bacterium GWA2_52_8]|nr:MAG: hypothetical protein A2Z83_05730 [Omnitrophica bacterium GWA2_52_8]
MLRPGIKLRPVLFMIVFFAAVFARPAAAQNVPAPHDEILDVIEKQSIQYFIDGRHPRTGLIQDRAYNFKKQPGDGQASIAATGFGLTVYPIAVERGWMDRGTAMEITRQTLLFFERKAASHRGFFYHFLDPGTGARSRGSELSPIDTAFFLAGALFAAVYYEDPVITETARRLYEKVDWPWMLQGQRTFAMAWSPETGFHKQRWDHYNEVMILYLLALGSPTHPVSPDSWHAVRRPAGSYRDFRMIQMPPLFTHQYSHAWIDFRNRHDAYADYFENSRRATLVNRAFCIDQATRFSGYGKNRWGLTATDGPFGYKAYGAPPGWAVHDGTVSPASCGASIVFTPEESIACLKEFYDNWQGEMWGQYGFSSSMNLDRQWFSPYVIGIDQGALILMIENYRSEFVWKTMARFAPLEEAMKKAGFTAGSRELDWPAPPDSAAPYLPGGIRVDGFLRDWPSYAGVVLGPEDAETGEVRDKEDLSARIQFAWDEKALYFMADVTDDYVFVKRSGKNIWQDDLLELFIDPENDGLYWNGGGDYQLGFRPDREGDTVSLWSWFQKGGDAPSFHEIQSAGMIHETGFIIEGAVRWEYLGLRPRDGMVLSISPAVHDIDKDGGSAKIHWFFRSERELGRYELGKLVLKKEQP